MTEFLLLAVLGAVLTMDGVTVGQFMLSRPLVAGGLAGLVLGDAATGLLLGAVLEMFLLVAVPSGGGRYPEPGPAAVVGAAGAVWVGGAAGLAVGTAAALVLGYLGALSQSVQRHLNERWVPDPAHGSVTAQTVTRGHLLGVTLDGVRGLFLSAVGLALMRASAPWAGEAWPIGDAETRGVLLLGAFVSLGIVGRTLLAGRRWVALAAGLLAGALAGWGLP